MDFIGEAHGSVEKGCNAYSVWRERTHHDKAGRVVRPFSIGLIWSFLAKIASKPFVDSFLGEF